MSREKSIRQQAKNSLKNNWAVAIGGLMTVFASWLGAYLIFSLLLTLFGSSDSNGRITVENDIVFLSILVASLLFLFALSPFINGFFKLCYNISSEKTADLSDCFYFFSRIKNYLDAIHFNAIILLKKFVYFLITFSPLIAFSIICAFFPVRDSLGSEAVNIISIILFVFGIIVGIILTLKFLIDEFAFASGEFRGLEEVSYCSRIIRKKHSGNIRMLIYSFTGWIALCFFVVPVIYVMPYLFTSAATSSKWLIKLYKEGKMV